MEITLNILKFNIFHTAQDKKKYIIKMCSLRTKFISALNLLRSKTFIKFQQNGYSNQLLSVSEQIQVKNVIKISIFQKLRYFHWCPDLQYRSLALDITDPISTLTRSISSNLDHSLR